MLLEKQTKEGEKPLRFEEKLGIYSKEDIWNEYCGFLDLNIGEYMQIQNRLLKEQIRLWGDSPLGQMFLKGRHPESIREFREMVPLTTYEDYADVLLGRKQEMLPAEPVIWIETTWEGGRHPVKSAPYTKGMLRTYQNCILACLILSTSSKKGEFDVSATDNILYALAPLPYPTGLFPVALNDEIGIGFLPPVKEAIHMTFSERNKKGFQMGMKRGIEFFFGMGSVAYFVSLSVTAMQGTKKGKDSLFQKISKVSPAMLVRLMKAKKVCAKEGRELMPRDLFHLKGFMCTGTDNWCYKDDLEQLWGIRPMELFAGTEPTCIGTETWTRKGMYFFPDPCFYEFIPEKEYERQIEDPDYDPQTVLMDEVVEGEKYELVITVLKGGAFARYRVGDIYRCVGLNNREDQTKIPRFQYLDRVPSVIDIAGFTRITEYSVQKAVELSGLPIQAWVVRKEYKDGRHPVLKMYAELKEGALMSTAVSKEILKNQLSIYFKYIDNDYEDLKKILGMDPLEVQIVRCRTFELYQKRCGRMIRHMNPDEREMRILLEGFEQKSAGRKQYV